MSLSWLVAIFTQYNRSNSRDEKSTYLRAPYYSLLTLQDSIYLMSLDEQCMFMCFDFYFLPFYTYRTRVGLY